MKHAIITGGGLGIGQAIALRIAEEMANAVVFLASERSAHTTGQITDPDGGYVHLDRAYQPDP